MKKFENVFWGSVLILIGVIVALNSFGITDIDLFFSGWWTLFIIIPSLFGIIKDSTKTGNYIALVIGLVLLLSSQNILDFENVTKLIFPAILVICGVSFIFKDTIQTGVTEKIKELNSTVGKKELEEHAAVFASEEIDVTGKEFKGANLDAVFGGVELNLRGAIIDSDKIINASAIFGGIEIIMPDNVNVIVKSTSIFGGVSNKNRKIQENLPTIYVKAFCLFGGVDVK